MNRWLAILTIETDRTIEYTLVKITQIELSMYIQFYRKFHIYMCDV